MLAANFVLLPFNYLVNSNSEGSRNQLADCSLHVLLILIHYHKCVVSDESITDRSDDSASTEPVSKVNTYFTVNPYSKALENAKDIECEISLRFPFGLLAFFLYSFLFLFFSRMSLWWHIRQYWWMYKNSACSWSCRCWGECTKWTSCEITFCIPIWYPWHVSVFLFYYQNVNK